MATNPPARRKQASLAGIPDVFVIPEYLDRKHSASGVSRYPIVLGTQQLEELEVDPVVLRFFRAPDDSMPPLRAGDFAIVDTSDTLPLDGGVYLIRHPRAGSYLRRVFIETDGLLILRPDNKSVQYREELIIPERAQELRFLGRARLALAAFS